jgi:hypothetical protein
MDAQPNEHFFEITLSQEGSDRIMRLFKTVRWLFLGSIVLSAAFLVLGYMILIMRDRLPGEKSTIFRVETVVSLVFTVVGVALMFGQLYSFFHFTRLCRKSIHLGQSDLFNYSFKWLLRSAVFSLSIVIFQFIYLLFSMYVVINLMRGLPAS